MLEKYPDRKCKVYLLHGDLTSGQMTGLYSNSKIKTLINIAHGEGFGLPLYEAAREALPIITIGWSGQQDFLHHDGKDYFNSVEFNAISQYHKGNHPTFAQSQWSTWYEHEGKDLITEEELTYLPFVNFIKRLGFNYEK